MLLKAPQDRAGKAMLEEIKAHKDLLKDLDNEALKQKAQESDNIDELAAIHELMPEAMVVDRIAEVLKDKKLSYLPAYTLQKIAISSGVQEAAQKLFDELLQKLLPEYKDDQELVDRFAEDLHHSFIGESTFNRLFQEEGEEDITEYMTSFLAHASRKKISEL